MFWYRLASALYTDTPKGEALTLYPCIDVIIAEAIRLSRASSYDEYTEKLKNWLIYCGDRVDTDQLVLLQNVFAYLQAYELEKVVLEYVVQNNLPHTEAQSERLAFLRKQSSSAFVVHFIVHSKWKKMVVCYMITVF